MTTLPSLGSALLHYILLPRKGVGGENGLWLIYWRLWLPREAEQDFQLPSMPYGVELCTSTLSPEGNAEEPGCLAEEEGPKWLGSKLW